MISYQKLDAYVLARIGITFDTDAETDHFIQVVQEEIEVRIGERISEGKTAAQMDEFIACDDSEASEWLNRNCPNYRQIIISVGNEIERELKSNRAKIPGAHIPRVFYTPLNEIKLSELTYKQLQEAGVKTVAEAVDLEDGTVPGLGRCGRRELKEKIDELMSRAGYGL